MPTDGMLSSKKWKIVRFSSESASNGKLAVNAIDADPTTWWHSQFAGKVAQPPHELVIDLGGEHTIRGFVYLARQDASWNGAIKDIEFYVSQSPDVFDQLTIKTTLARKKEPQTVECRPTRGRYVLLRAHSAHGAQAFASAAEFGVLGE
ncbi:MAG: discoidin domain-containing protein [Pirellulaceae bacterium]